MTAMNRVTARAGLKDCATFEGGATFECSTRVAQTFRSATSAGIAGLKACATTFEAGVTGLKVCATAVVLAFALSSQALAQTAVPARLTLDEALRRAQENSHRLGELKAQESAAAAVLAQRKTADLPVVSLQAGYQRTNHVTEFAVVQPDRTLHTIYPDVPDNWRSRADFQWPIYTGGRSQALERAAEAERQASGKDLDNARADLRLETTRAFWALVTATESVRVVGESVTRVEAQLSDVKARYDAGFLPPNDVLTVETRVSQERTLLIDAKSRRDSGRAELARLMGAPVDADFEPDARLESASAQATAQSAFNADAARRDRADRQALELRARAADALIASAKAGFLPTVAIAAGYDYARPNPKIFPREDSWQRSWDVGFNINWELWNGGRTKAEVAEAHGQATAARERLAELDSVIALEVRQRQLDLQSALAQVETANAGVKSAMEARRVVQERFTAGVATSTDLLDAQQDQLQAELDRTRALANVRLAEAQLARALGH
jgi:outer membrane protein